MVCRRVATPSISFVISTIAWSSASAEERHGVAIRRENDFKSVPRWKTIPPATLCTFHDASTIPTTVSSGISNCRSAWTDGIVCTLLATDLQYRSTILRASSAHCNGRAWYEDSQCTKYWSAGFPRLSQASLPSTLLNLLAASFERGLLSGSLKANCDRSGGVVVGLRALQGLSCSISSQYDLGRPRVNTPPSRRISRPRKSKRPETPL